MDISFPEDIKKFTAFKGSIAVNGISLTISYLDKDFFTVCLIPHTIKNTTLGNKKAGDKVNLEVDIISRYLKQLFDERDSQASYEFLEERGFI
jgi:riboflavin synthase